MFLIPTPRKICMCMGEFIITPQTEIVLHSSCSFDDLESIRLLKEEIKSVLGYDLHIRRAFHNKPDTIFFRRKGSESENYQINISEKRLDIKACDGSGIFYAVQTLRQIIRQEKAILPALVIEDEPYFRIRGFYHDVTRGKVPTLDTLKELVDRLSFYKINQLQLYIEHTFAFRNMSEVWTGKDPLTAEEIILLDEYCKKRNVELVPSLSTFGHLYEVLSTTSFSHLCELDHNEGKLYSWVDRMRHHTLDVSNPGSIKLIEDMLEEFVPLFSSDKFNICCDETFDLGKGKNRKLAETLGTGRLYVDYLNKVIGAVKKYNKKVMFWGDIILKHPELLNEIPKDVTCLNWHYGPNPKEEETRIIAESGLDQYVCPGTDSWNRLISNMNDSFTNITNMVELGRKYGASGVLNTDWGDFGHINPLAVSMPGMIYGGSLSWNPDGEKDACKFDKAVSVVEYGDESGSLIGLIREISKTSRIIWWHIVMWREAKLLEEPELNKWFDVFRNIKVEEIVTGYHKSAGLTKELVKHFGSVSKLRSIDLKEFIVAAKSVTLLNAIFLVIKKYDLGQSDIILLEEPKILAEKLEYWFLDYGKIWRARNKESELARIRENIVYFCNYLRKQAESV